MSSKQKRYSKPGAAFLVLLALGSQAFGAKPPSDDTLQTFVASAIGNDSRIGESQITVSVRNGIATLTGSTDHLAAKRFAAEQAKTISGVVGVVNELYVSAGDHLDADIANAVHRRVLSNASVESSDLHVVVSAGEVTLRGTVSSWTERLQVGFVAAATPGVREVTNHLDVVLQRERSDAAIQQDIAATFDRDVYLSGLPIRVSVRDSTVVLLGKVGSGFEKDRAGLKASRIAGVKSINNKIMVEWIADRVVRNEVKHRSDAELKSAVLASLAQDNRLRGQDITVTVARGFVTLSGSVAHLSQRRIAEQDARDVIGVGRVSNGLVAVVSKRADELIAKDIEANFATDYVLGGSQLKAEVIGGVVVLTGAAQTRSAKSYAGDVAASVRGVRQVINEITVNETRTLADLELSQAVMKRLKRVWRTWPVRDAISVDVIDGVANLTGTVNTWGERNGAAAIAHETAGIRRVDNFLIVHGYNYPWKDWIDEDAAR